MGDSTGVKFEIREPSDNKMLLLPTGFDTPALWRDGLRFVMHQESANTWRLVLIEAGEMHFRSVSHGKAGDAGEHDDRCEENAEACGCESRRILRAEIARLLDAERQEAETMHRLGVAYDCTFTDGWMRVVDQRDEARSQVSELVGLLIRQQDFERDAPAIIGDKFYAERSAERNKQLEELRAERERLIAGSVVYVKYCRHGCSPPCRECRD